VYWLKHIVTDINKKNGDVNKKNGDVNKNNAVYINEMTKFCLYAPTVVFGIISFISLLWDKLKKNCGGLGC